MSGEVVVALITLLGSAIGTIGGIFAPSLYFCNKQNDCLQNRTAREKG